jgi:hypothetical protein
MTVMIRTVKGLAVLAAVVALGLGLRWVTAGSVAGAATRDLASMATLAVSVIGWIAYAWLLMAVLAVVLEQAPGAVGRSAVVISGWVTSHGSRALLRSAVGVAAVTPLTLTAAHAVPGDSTPQVVTQRTATPAEAVSAHHLGAEDRPRWLETEPPSTVRLAGGPSTKARAGEAGRQRIGVPDRPTVGAPTRYTDLQSGRKIRPVKPGQPASQVVVRPGDSLWALAAAELGPGAGDAAVDARWPQWYAANAAVIGPDPDRLTPGQVLRTPDRPGRPVPTTPQEK